MCACVRARVCVCVCVRACVHSWNWPAEKGDEFSATHHLDAVQQNLTGGWLVEVCNARDERALAAARLPNNRDRLPRGRLQAHAIEHAIVGA